MAKAEPIARWLTPAQAGPCDAAVSAEMQRRRHRMRGTGCTAAAAVEIEGRKLCRRHAGARLLALLAGEGPKRAGP